MSGYLFTDAYLSSTLLPLILRQEQPGDVKNVNGPQSIASKLQREPSSLGLTVEGVKTAESSRLHSRQASEASSSGLAGHGHVDSRSQQMYMAGQLQSSEQLRPRLAYGQSIDDGLAGRTGAQQSRRAGMGQSGHHRSQSLSQQAFASLSAQAGQGRGLFLEAAPYSSMSASDSAIPDSLGGNPPAVSVSSHYLPANSSAESLAYQAAAANGLSVSQAASASHMNGHAPSTAQSAFDQDDSKAWFAMRDPSRDLSQDSRYSEPGVNLSRSADWRAHSMTSHAGSQLGFATGHMRARSMSLAPTAVPVEHLQFQQGW